MDVFDIFIAYVAWGSSGKLRPVLVIERQDTFLSVFNITTRYEGKSTAILSKYFKINDWQQVGLHQESYIDTNSTATLPHSAIENRLGTLTEYDAQQLIKFLTNIGT